MLTLNPIEKKKRFNPRDFRRRVSAPASTGGIYRLNESMAR